MSIKNADMPAHPLVALDSKDNPVPITTYGLTKREMIAMHFHAALLTAQTDGAWSGIDANAAFHAVQEADALLAELEKTSK